MAKITATAKQHKKLEEIQQDLSALSYDIESAGQELTVGSKLYYFVSEKELFSLRDRCTKIEAKVNTFLNKEVHPWV